MCYVLYLSNKKTRVSLATVMSFGDPENRTRSRSPYLPLLFVVHNSQMTCFRVHEYVPDGKKQSWKLHPTISEIEVRIREGSQK